MAKSLEPEVQCHEAKSCIGRLYSISDEECRACAGEESIPPDWEEYDRKFGIR